MPNHYIDESQWMEIISTSHRLCHKCRGKAQFVRNKVYICRSCLNKVPWWKKMLRINMGG